MRRRYMPAYLSRLPTGRQSVLVLECPSSSPGVAGGSGRSRRGFRGPVAEPWPHAMVCSLHSVADEMLDNSCQGQALSENQHIGDAGDRD